MVEALSLKSRVGRLGLVVYQVTPDWSRVRNAIDEAVDAVWRNQEDLRSAVVRIDEEVGGILRQVRRFCRRRLPPGLGITCARFP